jgi:esterase
VKDHTKNNYISINNLCLHYMELGKEVFRPMILLHGSGDNAHIWDYFASYALNHFRIINLDQRGHGDSDWAIPPAYSCDDYVSDLSGLIEALKLTGVILMGHSMGALHAAMYASMRPDKVAGLIYMDIEPYPPFWNKKYLRGLYDTLPEFYNSSQDFVNQARETSKYAKKEILSYLASFALKKKEDDKFYRKFDIEVLNHFDQYDLRLHLGYIKCPTLIIRGEESRVMRREIAQEMNQNILNSKLVEIPHAGHPVCTDNPTNVQQVVLDFLKDTGLIDR